jgi:molybdopterin-guanine dinucleotide biosynthesis protein MobB
MQAFSFIGSSGSGKTRLIARLIGEMKKRGQAVGVIKHCPHGFSLDRGGKDSRRFFDVGARSVGLISPEATAVIQRNGSTPDFLAFGKRHFQDVDILLIEGGRARKGIRKIEVLGEDERCRPIKKADERIAVVSDHGQPCGRPVFRHSQIREIAGFLESQPGEQESGIIRVGSHRR